MGGSVSIEAKNTIAMASIEAKNAIAMASSELDAKLRTVLSIFIAMAYFTALVAYGPIHKTGFRNDREQSLHAPVYDSDYLDWVSRSIEGRIHDRHAGTFISCFCLSAGN